MTSLLTVESCSSSTVPPLLCFSSSLVWCVCRPRAQKLWSCLSATFCLNRQLQMGVDGGTIVSLWSVLHERMCDECLSSGAKAALFPCWESCKRLHTPRQSGGESPGWAALIFTSDSGLYGWSFWELWGEKVDCVSPENKSITHPREKSFLTVKN